MAFQSAKEFADAIKRYCNIHKIPTKELAGLTKRATRTVEDWKYTGVKNPKKQDEIMQEFPWLFAEQPPEILASDDTPIRPLTPAKPASKRSSEIQVLMKIELGRHGIVVLSDILQWFIDASPEERNHFREELGPLWKKFLELTRAMTGERALELALQEGRVTSGNNNA
jgi:hypothetical protein